MKSNIHICTRGKKKKEKSKWLNERVSGEKEKLLYIIAGEGRGNERLPRGNGWLTMHIMGALVRIHLVILMIAFTFKRSAHKPNGSGSFKLHSHLAGHPVEHSRR